MNDAQLIEKAIPDELRLAPHPDAALINEALATVIVALNNSDYLTLSGKMNDVRKALLAFHSGTYVKHIAEEDELWTSMQAKAEKYRPEAHLITTRPMKGGFSRYSYTMDNEKGTIVVMSDEGKYVAEYMVFGTDIPVASAAMDSEREALASLFMGRGALVVIDGSPLIPMPARMPVIEEMSDKEPAHPPIADSGLEVIKTKVNVLEGKRGSNGVVELRNLQPGSGPVWRGSIVFEVYVDGSLMVDGSGDTDYGRLVPDIASFSVQLPLPGNEFNGLHGNGKTVDEAIASASKSEPYSSRAVTHDDSFAESNPLIQSAIEAEANERLSSLKRVPQEGIRNIQEKIQKINEDDSLKAAVKAKKLRDIQSRYQSELDRLNDQLTDISAITTADIIRQAREGNNADGEWGT